MLKSPEQLHPFLNGLYKKVENSDRADKALAVTDKFMNDYRENSRGFLFGEGEIPGYKSFALYWDPLTISDEEAQRNTDSSFYRRNEVNFSIIYGIGVLEDGRITDGKMAARQTKDNGSMSKEWTSKFKDDADPFKSAALVFAKSIGEQITPQTRIETEEDEYDNISYDDVFNVQDEDKPYQDLTNIFPRTQFSRVEITSRRDSIPLQMKSAASYKFAKDKSKNFYYELKKRLEGAGLLKYQGTDEESKDAKAIHSGLHRATGAVFQQEDKTLAMIRKCVTEKLDPDTLKIARSLNSVSKETINWLSGQPVKPKNIYQKDDWLDDGEFAMSDAEVCISDSKNVLSKDILETTKRGRQQAIGAYPVLGSFIMKSHDVTDAIDKGQALSESLQKSLNLSPAHLKRIQGQSWQRTGRQPFNDPVDSFTSLSKGPLEFVPTTQKDWKDYNMTLILAKEYSRGSNCDTNKVMSDLKGRFDVIAKVGKNHVPGGMEDAGRHIAQHLTTAALALSLKEKGMTEPEIFTNMPSVHKIQFKGPTANGGSLRQALETTEKWHILQTPFDSKMRPDAASGKTWPATGIDGIKHPDFNFVELNSTQLLTTEGRKQDHCSAGYSDGCLQGKCLVISVRDKKNKILSTVDLTPQKTDKGWTFNTRQNMGKGNNEQPGRDAFEGEKIVKRYLKSLPQEKLDQWAWDLQKEKQKRDAEKRTIKDKVGYDPYSKDNVKEAYKILKPALPKSWGRKSYEDWMEQTIEPQAKQIFDNKIEIGQEKPKARIQFAARD